MNYREELEQVLSEERRRAQQGLEPDVELVIRRGILYGQLSDVDNALGALDEAERMEREGGLAPSPRIPLNRGAVLMTCYKADEALHELSRAENMYFARGQVVHPAVHVNRGAALRQLGNPEAALESYDRAERAARELGIPEHHMQHVNRAVVLDNLGRFDEALVALDQAEAIQRKIGAEPDSLIAMNRGLTLAQLCRFEEAEQSLSLADKQRQEAGQILHPMVALNRVILQLNKGDIPSALEFINETHWRYGKLNLQVPEIVRQYQQDILRRAAEGSPGTGLCDDSPALSEDAESAAVWEPRPPAAPETTAFLSHRRREGHAYARLIKANFEMRGHRAFLDIDEKAPTTRFDERLLQALDRARSFVLILTPGALDRCVNEGDWLRREIHHALIRRKNIVPIMMPEFKWPRMEDLPEDIRPLSLCEGLSYSHEYFAAFIDMLVSWCNRPASALT
jgi:tetratricopeptide (TPR) repeat protein